VDCLYGKWAVVDVCGWTFELFLTNCTLGCLSRVMGCVNLLGCRCLWGMFSGVLLGVLGGGLCCFLGGLCWVCCVLLGVLKSGCMGFLPF